MPARNGEGAPTDHVITGVWPHAILDGHPGAAYAQRVARRLDAAITEQGLSRREVARRAGLANVTVAAVLNGRNFADLRTIGALEVALYTNLLYDPNRFAVTA